jgi:hypothetical protein
MQTPIQLCGIDLLYAEWIAIAAYLALGAWLWFRWARDPEITMHQWKFGDPPRRPRQSFVERVYAHIGGVAVFLTCCIFALQRLGIG